jgi:hypothetical protein
MPAASTLGAALGVSVQLYANAVRATAAFLFFFLSRRRADSARPRMLLAPPVNTRQPFSLRRPSHACSRNLPHALA